MNEHNARIGWSAAAITLVVLTAALGVWLSPSGGSGSEQIALSDAPAVTVVDVAAVYDPYIEGDPLPEGFRQLLDRDQIAPVYDPQYTTADQVDWPDGMLVIGVEGTETAKAFPITHLNQREMVLDDLDGMPILVSW